MRFLYWLSLMYRSGLTLDRFYCIDLAYRRFGIHPSFPSVKGFRYWIVT
jgi:hypothetical protein